METDNQRTNPMTLPPLPWSEEQAKAAVDVLEKSGQSVATFAKTHKIPAHRLRHWKKKLSATQDATANGNGLLHVRVGPQTSKPSLQDQDARIEVVTASGLSLRFREDMAADRFAEFIAACGGPSC